MKSKFFFGLVLFVLANRNTALVGGEDSVGKQLQVYYEKGTPPPWGEAIKDLAAENAEKRGAAAKYLASLLDQAQTDELSGKAPWRATIKWGGGGENPARDLRRQIAEELAESQGSSATLAERLREAQATDAGRMGGPKEEAQPAEQIIFLAERVRLLNCFQCEQPGDYALHEVQFGEPCGMARDASWGLGRGTTKVINPYVELVGGSEDIFFDDEKKPYKGMELTVADIPLLAPFLRDDWHILCVSYWRNFAPKRHLETTRPLFASIINDLAKRDVCQTHDMEKLNEAEREKHIEKIVRWAKANENKSEQDLMWETSDEEFKAGKSWDRLTRPLRLIEMKDKRVLPVLQKYLETTTSENDLRSLLNYCHAYDPAAFQAQAKKLAKHKRIDLRLAAGRILFAGGNQVEGRAVFADILENGGPGELEGNALPKLVKTLLKEGSHESKQAARLIFKNK